MSTRLRSFDGEVITLPNDTVRADPIVDRSRRSRLRGSKSRSVSTTTPTVEDGDSGPSRQRSTASRGSPRRRSRTP